MNAMNRNLKCR